MFLGRAWQHLRWDAPWRVLFWDEKWLKWPVESVFGISWGEWAGAEMDARISLFIQFIGGFFVVCALAALLFQQKNTPQKLNKIFEIILIIGGILLILLALLYAKDRNWQLTLLMEFVVQCSLPFLLVGYLNQSEISSSQKQLLLLKILIAITFVGHGFYAVGWPFPQPASFVGMTMEILPLDENTAYGFIYLMGILDFIAALFLFIPKTQRVALYYCMIWGLLTAIARLWAGFYIEMPWDSLSQWAHEVLVRLPHGGLPLLVLMLLRKNG